MSYIFNEKIECMSKEDKKAYQGKKLREVVERVYNNVAPYRAKMDAIGLKPEDINSIDDIVKLPFTTKEALGTFQKSSLFK